MSSDENLIDFSAERARRIHDLNDKRLEEMRKTFEQVLPLASRRRRARSPRRNAERHPLPPISVSYRFVISAQCRYSRFMRSAAESPCFLPDTPVFLTGSVVARAWDRHLAAIDAGQFFPVAGFTLNPSNSESGFGGRSHVCR